MLNIPQMEPSFGDEERDALSAYLNQDPSPWLTEFDKTRELETMIAGYVGSKHCFMTPNATLALYAMLMVCDIGPGDEVIIPDFTMVATANAVRMTGATVRFVDVKADTWCMDLDKAWKIINSKTRAILPVHINGRSIHMVAATALAQSNDIVLLEDAAQALGSTWNGKHLGTFGLMGAYSFSSQKIVSTGNGGCVVTDDDDIAERLRMFRDF